jgi:hypothetical protein
MPERAEVGLQGLFGLDRGLAGRRETGDERLLIGDDLARRRDALRQQNKFGPLPGHGASWNNAIDVNASAGAGANSRADSSWRGPGYEMRSMCLRDATAA